MSNEAYNMLKSRGYLHISCPEIAMYFDVMSRKAGISKITEN